MAIFCRQYAKPTAHELAFCQALLNNENPIWEDNDVTKIRKKGFYRPPDDFVYGLKHPKQDGITGVAAGKTLQHYETPIDIRKPIIAPDFIAINKAATRLGLTKVRDIHQYRRTMNNHQIKQNSCYCPSIKNKSISDMTHGRVTGTQPLIRDIIENKYLHEWLTNSALRRCKEILNNNTSKKIQKLVHLKKYQIK